MIERKDLLRFFILGGFIAVVVIFILWKYFALMVIQAPGAERAEPARATERGPILDRNGRILAIETRQDSVSAWLPNVPEKEVVAEKLAPILGVSASDLAATLAAHDGFAYLKRKVSQIQARQIQSLIDANELPGISLQPEFARIYPEGDLAGHAIGYVGIDNVGLAGIEYAFNNQLSPPAGAAGEAAAGNQVFLTLDLNVQFFAQQTAVSVFEQTKADSVMLVVMDAKNGDLLGYVSVPEIDPNNYAGFSSDARMDRLSQYVYEPGSVLKVFTISSFLQLGGITPTTRFYDDGVYTKALSNGSLIQIRGLAPRGYEDPRLIIKYSSNVGAAYSSDTVSDEAFFEMLRKFGFGQPTYLGLPGETTGILRPVNQWTARSKPTIAFGQEIGVSALQVVAAATAIANDGVLLKPHIVRKIVAPDGRVVQRFPREPIRRVVSPEVAREMLSFMETATEPGGTAVWAKIPGVNTSAKTGTSNIYDPKSGKYSESAYVASTLAIFPTDDPQLIVYSVIVNPREGSIYGARVAAPIVREVAERLVSYMNIPKSTDQTADHSGAVSAQASAATTLGGAIPDLLGLSKRELIPLLSDGRIHMVVKGNGWVVAQNPAPGTPVTKGMTVTVELQ
ncbi:MAG TPA: penicillin-binding protein [Spirochaetia bacterium]|nr:penicillin-binding protein [Spirochaetia bacterium]